MPLPALGRVACRELLEQEITLYGKRAKQAAVVANRLDKSCSMVRHAACPSEELEI